MVDNVADINCLVRFILKLIKIAQYYTKSAEKCIILLVVLKTQIVKFHSLEK